MYHNITVIVRSVGERTEVKCIEHLEKIFGKDNIFLVKNVMPFSNAVKKTFEIGLKQRKKWTLAIDADVFLFEDKINEFLNEATKFVSKTKDVYCLEGKLFDKFSQTYREVGFHLYQTKYLKYAKKYVMAGYLKSRPETHVKLQMAKEGYGFYSNQMRIGIHDFFQSPKSIVKKAILHCKKHVDIDFWLKLWAEHKEQDNDFYWALKGKEIFDSLGETKIIVDSNYMDKLITDYNLEIPNEEELSENEIIAVLKKYNDTEKQDETFKLVFDTKKRSLLNVFFSKEKSKNKRIIKILGVKISYKKRLNKFLNVFLESIKPYKSASHKIWTLNKEDKLKALKLDWNEATISPSPLVVARLKEMVLDGDFYNLYPSTENKTIIELLSKYTNLENKYIQYFASSDSIHEYVAKIFIGINDKVLIQGPSYDNFRLTAQANGAKIIYSEVGEDFRFNPENFESDIDRYKPEFVYISNPNNPLGYVHSVEYIERLLKKYKKTLFLIDEAYYEFSKITCSQLVKKYQNILVTRTMSKAFAIANFRFGYLLASEENINNISNIRNPKNITTLTQEAAISALKDVEYMESYVEEVKKAKEIFIEKMKNYNKYLQVYESQANFVVLRFNNEEEKEKLFTHLADNLIFVRMLSQSPILKTSLRVTIGTLEQMSHVVDIIENFYENVCNTKCFDKNTDKIALFDFCNTIVNFSTADRFIDFVRKEKSDVKMKIKEEVRKFLNKTGFIKFLQKFYDKNINKMLYLWQLKGMSYRELDEFAKFYYENLIKKRLIKETIEEIDRLKKADYRLLVVSGGYDIYLKYFVKDFDFDGLISTKIAFKNEKVTSKIEGLDCLGENKVVLLKDFFQKENLKSIDSIAYSDSMIDLPLLNYCKKGVVVSFQKSSEWVSVNNFEEIICSK